MRLLLMTLEIVNIFYWIMRSAKNQ